MHCSAKLQIQLTAHFMCTSSYWLMHHLETNEDYLHITKYFDNAFGDLGLV